MTGVRSEEGGFLSKSVPFTLFILIASLIGAACCAFIYYCERLQLSPYTVKGLTARLGAAALAGGAFFVVLYFLLRKVIQGLTKNEWIPIILISLITSVCMIIWFPIPKTGLYKSHHLTIRALPDENGEVRPVTLTWLHHNGGDIPLKSLQCAGRCTPDEYGITLTDENSELSRNGIIGGTLTIEFVSDENQGIAEFRYDRMSQTAPLNNTDMNRLSFDITFPPSDGLPEFIAVWLISFLLCLAGSIAAFKLLPGWSVKGFALCAFICFTIFRVIQFLTVREPLFFVDSESYLGMSEMSVMDILRGTPYCHQQFWYCIARPAFIPLIYKFCRQDPTAITITQLVISILCWGFFAWQSAGICRRDSRKKAVILLTLGLGCIPNVTRWDQMIMSESLSISAALILMGSCFWLIRPNPENKWKLLLALCTAAGALLYSHSRDSAAWIVILILVLLLCLNRLRNERKVLFLLCAVLAAICWSVMGNTGGRWQYPFENVLFNRILRDPQGEQFFLQAGMPTPERIEELYGVEHMMGSELFNSDAFTPLREWILSDGLKTYIRYMLHIPFETLCMTWYEGFEKEAFEQIGYIYTPSGFGHLLPDPFVKFFSCNLPGVLVFSLGLAGIWAAFRRKDGERYAFPLLFIFSAYILSTGVFIADEYELARHSMVIILMMKASTWPLICMLTEEFHS